MEKTKIYLDKAIEASFLAGKEIMDVYDSKFTVEIKSDNTPLTQADISANKVICEELQEFNIPIISEESEENLDFIKRSEFKKYWLIDPLDGTKEFVKRNGEFSVNIALMENNKPILGVIFFPVLDLLYYGSKNDGSFKVEHAKSEYIKKDNFLKKNRLPSFAPTPFTILVSHNFFDQKTKDWISLTEKQFAENANILAFGSSLKICKIAEGSAKFYPRFGPSKEWDIAAATIILEESGGEIIEIENSSSIQFNKSDLGNPNFLARR